MTVCELKGNIDKDSFQRKAGMLRGISNEANADLFIPFIVFNKEQVKEKMIKSKQALDELVT